MTALMASTDDLFADAERVTALREVFPADRVGACPYCRCVAVFKNTAEFNRHVGACLVINDGLELLAKAARR